MKRRAETLIDRFWDKVDAGGENGCWMWLSYKDRKGYGRIRSDGEARLAHRVSYELHRGAIPSGLFVCHGCDNRLCVNPDHLFVGSAADNVADMDSKGRRAASERTKHLGAAHGRAKLTELQVRAIRLAGSLPQRRLAKIYGVSQSHIHRKRSGESWASLSSVNRPV